MTSASIPSPREPLHRRRSAIIFVVGAALVVLALWSVHRQGTGISGILASARAAPTSAILATFLLPFVNWLVTAASFWVLTNRYGRVGAGEMGALIGAAWLINYLPLRPGLAGRVAYHKKVNDIAIGDSVRILAMSIACSAGATVLLITAVLIGGLVGARYLPVLILAPFAIIVPTVLLRAWRASPNDSKGDLAWRLGASLALRYADALVWAARYGAASQLVGDAWTPGQSAAAASVAQAVNLIPLAGNGLGIREWAIALVSSHLPAAFLAGGIAPTTAAGLSVDIVNRAAEMIAALIVGGAGIVVIASRLSRTPGAFKPSHSAQTDAPIEHETDASRTPDQADRP